MAPKSLFGVPWCNNALAHLVMIFIWYVQINKAKDTIAVLLSKSKNDDLLINALSAELAGARQVPDLKCLLISFFGTVLQYVEDLTYHLDNNTPLALFFSLFKISCDYWMSRQRGHHIQSQVGLLKWRMLCDATSLQLNIMTSRINVKSK